MKSLFSIIFIMVGMKAFGQAPVTEWENTISGDSQDEARSIVCNADGSMVIAGNSTSGISGDRTDSSQGGYDAWILKLDPAGNIVWQNAIGTYGSDGSYCIRPDANGYILAATSIIIGISGDKTVAGYGAQDFWIIKLNDDGNIVWQKDFGGNSTDLPLRIESLSDGGYIVGGYSYSAVSGNKTEPLYGDEDYWIIRLDSSGNELWQKALGGAGDDKLTSLLPTPDGGFIAGGYSSSNISGNKTVDTYGSTDYWVIKLDGAGAVVWQKTYGGIAADKLASMLLTSDGGYLIGGSSSSGISGNKTDLTEGGGDYWILKLDQDGNIQWQKTIGGSSADQLTSLALQTNDGYVLAGGSQSAISGSKTVPNQGNLDYWVVGLNSLGNILWQKNIGGSDWDQCHEIQLDLNGNILLAGQSSSPISGDKSEATMGFTDYWIIKLSFDSLGCSTCSLPIAVHTTDSTATSGQVYWTGNDCAIKYRVRVKNMSTGQTSLHFVLAPDTTKALTGLSPNTLYKVQVRSQCSTNGSIFSPWSSPVYFTTLPSTATVCIPPTNPSATATSNSTAAINWTSVSGANGYQLRYRINGTTIWTPLVINNGLATSANLTSLQANTAYQYQLRTKCSTNPLTWSNYSAIQTFSTPLRIADDTQTTSDVFPNPSSGVFTVTINTTQLSNASVNVFSIDGKLLHSQNALVEAGASALEINGTAWSAGVYVVKISCDNGVTVKKIVLQ